MLVISSAADPMAGDLPPAAAAIWQMECEMKSTTTMPLLSPLSSPSWVGLEQDPKAMCPAPQWYPSCHPFLSLARGASQSARVRVQVRRRSPQRNLLLQVTPP